ncbi:hypothetical protein [Streptomyces antibioticus]|uniref:hypothetical protein n=1 Tax=Streptomyces antibioticus TaxID=1890 RepID=UPI0033FD9362
MASSDGYQIKKSGMTGQAEELDGAGDDMGTVRAAVAPSLCYAADTLGGTTPRRPSTRSSPPGRRRPAPWSRPRTTWVSEDDFINGNMGKASNSELDNAHQVCVPQ